MKKNEKGFSNLQLVLASFAFGSVMVFWTIYNSYVPLILDDKLSHLGSVKLSAAAVSTLTGMIMTIDNLFGLIFQPIFGAKSDHMRSRFGKRMPYVIVGILVCAVLFALIPVMARISGLSGVFAMMVVIIIFNFVMSTWRAPCVAIMPDMVPVEYQSDGNAIVNMMSAVFTILATVSATVLGFFGLKDAIDGGDYFSVFLFGSILSVVCLVVLITCVHWKDNRGEAAGETKETVKTDKQGIRDLGLEKAVLRSMLFMMAALFCTSGSMDGLNTYFTLYCTKLLGMTASLSTLIKTAGTLGALVLAVPAGIAGRKLGRRRTIMTGVGIIIVVHVLLFIMPYVIHGSAVTILLSIGYFVYAGAYIMVNINTLPIMLAIGGKERFGAFTGFYYTATFTAAVACPVVIGYIVGTTGYNSVHIFCLVLMVLALFLLSNVHHGERLSDEDEAALEEAVKAASDD